MVLAKVTSHHSLPMGLDCCGLRSMSCFKTRVVCRPQSRACKAAQGCVWLLRHAGRLLGTAKRATLPWTGYSSNSFKIFQERNKVFYYDLAVFS